MTYQGFSIKVWFWEHEPSVIYAAQVEQRHGERQKSGESRSLGPLRAMYATKQSYIQSFAEGKWALVVACSCKQADTHAAIIEEILKTADHTDLGKADLVAIRNSLVS